MSAQDFGANDWLVDEMYEQYVADPTSVDPTWVEYFKVNRPGSPAGSGSTATNQPVPALSKPVPPVPKSQQAPTQPAPVQQAPVATPVQQAPVQQAPVQQAPVQQAPVQQPIVRDTASPQPTPADPVVKAAPVLATPSASTLTPIRGVSARVVQSMEASLTVPTATSVRAVAAKLMIDNRIVINNHLKRARGGKTSFTHLIAYAMIKAVRAMPEMNAFFGELDGKPAVGHPEHINLGIAIDLAKSDGSRQLLVPSVKGCESMDFAQFWGAYEAIIKKARGGSLTVDDFAGTTLSITNPGTIGTVHSVPRLVQGQGLILGVGALDYPAEFHGTSEETLARMAISKVVTLTSTYDHRVIQGAQSGDFLRRMNEYLLGADGFYDEIFASLRIPYEPIRWAKDFEFSKDEQINKTARIQQLIHAYRTFGHLMADVDPLEYKQRSHPDLDVVTHGLTLWDLDREFATGGFGGEAFMPLRKILGLLRDAYCRTVGVEYMYIEDRAERQWIQEHVEVIAQKFAPEEHLRILHKLNGAEAFETFLQTKFVGQKRFSLEGGESVIPLLDAVLSSAADEGLDEVCVGMPHRGRLNVLANIAGKSHGQIFQEFQGHYAENQVQGSGDVKYHLGTEGFFTSHAGATTKIYLAANPSHLEAVNPVLEGIVRAKQDKLNVKNAYSVLPVLLHGDASFAGQGVNAEVLQMSQLAGYRTGGTIHIVVNNQVGFTTSPHASRTATYSTDFAKIIQAPVFHVNGDDPEACVRIARLAFEYRQEFNKDVVIDMVCYRRRGHNEGDEPSFTQPLMYKMIDAKRSTRTLYIEALIGRGDISLDEAEEVARDYQSQLEAVYAAVNNLQTESDPNFKAPVAPDAHEIITSISESLAREIAATQSAIPDGFNVHPKLLPQLAKRVESLNDSSIDWSTGEMLAFGSLLKEDRPIRLAGQDARRGTFSNRHAVIIDKENGNEWTPLRALNSDENHFFVIDSLLSEYAAMGFEYGYSLEREDALVLWEGQFGDFANGAQTIIDEFISSALQKWGERSSVVLLLPHGYEGQGPDHSSARIERYLQLCAEQNMTVAQPSTPASYFHLLRWHAHNPARRPLIIFTPKSMLRLRAAASSLSDFTSGHFRPVISDESVNNASRLIFCSGKIYHDLVAERAKTGETSTAIVRLELLYPLPIEEMLAEANKHPNANLLWVQDEPANQGPWSHIALRTSEQHGGRGFGSRILRRVSRRATASPATGNHHLHEDEQKALMLEAFTR
ncbi:MAG: multifunctional oxoglutarate decarboxylase/oxoglutarate dehydrogenase thiamine pyrophosphate-binding subunit/dihydrolipoyllysine-residue succinyltransferase subunit [Actinobacteria bacterium]|uniref:oxoglutarate dehydrogenase (succinyl-transferring) n=1 Tax=freshwater metagenome TaxID=449393 RepID=A0A6J7VQ82_9ZZZZ|nr:multifunctional oxoglutarate decarboxylase/oxoglutarate dehydrogenase thiamine pyrophosphate-binding subunit/dihydrolipoyllysine-residue succinyltransferase subunit [Actinomycetota bacterium]